MDSESSSSEDLSLDKEDGWEDVEKDEEDIKVISLFDDRVFVNATDMLVYCKDTYDFDIWKTRREMNLDLIGLIKLVNYIRSESKAGSKSPGTLSKSAFDHDQYLQPVLADDALLYSLEDVFGSELYEDIEKPANELEDLRRQLASTQLQFEQYREQVQAALLKRLEGDEDQTRGSNASNGALHHPNTTNRNKSSSQKVEEDYFQSYSYNTIHEFMLKDAIRTDAYRDFIYDHKQLFAGKIILDVGCGTGILSMFCAKAGAKIVIAVDNSNIIDKARENVHLNGLQDKVRCLRGKIEEVTMPVPQVDIIVSEWMGYCLLFESMLDSVIYARDKYLAPNGLMVPSHAAIRIAPLADSDLKASHIDFWRDVYGFDMTPMLEKAHEEALIRTVDDKELAAESASIAQLDLHTVRVTDLDFTSSFKLKWKANFDRLEGFILWFDIIFATSRSDQNSTQEEEITVADAKQKGWVAFSTGPASPSTHWQQGVCLIQDPSDKLKEGDEIEGEISYQKMVDRERSLDIEIKWAKGEEPRRSQKWFLD